MSTPNALTVFDASASPCARRLKIVLKEKGLPFDTVRLDLGRGDQKDPRYLALNANGTVPTLVHNGFAIGETNAAIRYLDDVFPETPLYPADPKGAQIVEHWAAEELAMAKLYRPLIYQKVIGPFQRITDKPPSPGEWGQMVWDLAVLPPEDEVRLVADLLHWLQRLDFALADQPYLMGEAATLADFIVAPRTRMLPILVGPFAGRFDNVARWINALDARPSFGETLIEAEAKLMKIGQTPLFPAARAMWGLGGKPSIKQRLMIKVAAPIMRKLAKTAAVSAPSFPEPKTAGPQGPVRTLVPFAATSADMSIVAPADDFIAQGMFAAAKAAGVSASWIDGRHFALKCGGESFGHHETAWEYIARAAPGAYLLGQTPAEVAISRVWLGLAQSLQKDLRLLLSGGPYPVSRETSNVEVSRLTSHVSAHVGQGAYLSGAAPGLADHIWARLTSVLSLAGFAQDLDPTWTHAVAQAGPQPAKQSA